MPVYDYYGYRLPQDYNALLDGSFKLSNGSTGHLQGIDESPDFPYRDFYFSSPSGQSSVNWFKFDWSPMHSLPVNVFSGYAFKFDFDFVFNGIDPNIDFSQCYLRVTFSDGQTFEIDGIQFQTRFRVRFNKTFEFTDYKQLTDISVFVKTDFNTLGDFYIRTSEDIYVSSTYNPSAPIIEYGQDDSQVHAYVGEVDEKRGKLDSLIASDTTPKYQYQSVNVSDEFYEEGQYFLSEFFSIPLISMLFFTCLSFCLIKYILFGKR